MNKLRKQSDSTYPLFFLMVDSTDHITGKTGLSPTVTISKNGGSFASPSGAVTEVGNGLYKVAGNATDSNTVGELWIHATGTGADPTDTSYTIVAYDPFDSVRLGLTALPNAAAESAGGLYTRGSGAGQINQSANGQIDSNAVKIGGTSQTGRDLGTSVLLSSGTGTGQISLSSGAVLLQPTQSGVTIPTVTTVTNLTNAPTNGDLTATMKTSVTTATSAATVTGVSGVVTANVTQINGSATNGNNAILKLKSLDIQSDSSSVNAVNIVGGPEVGSGRGGNGVSIQGGASNGSHGYGLYVAPGGSGSGSAPAVFFDAKVNGCYGLQISGSYVAPIYLIRGGFGTTIIDTEMGSGIGDINANLSGYVNSLNTQAKADVNAEVKDVIETDAQAEPSSVPASTASLRDKIGWLFTLGKNKRTQTATTETVLADNETTPIATSTKSDTGGTFTRGKYQ